MSEFWKRLFGKSQETPLEDPSSDSCSFSQTEPVIRKYFGLHAKIEAAKKSHDYRAAIKYARQTYPLFPAFVEAWKRQYERFDIQSSVAVETGSTLMAVMGDREGIAELHKALSGVSELQIWIGAAEKAEQDADVVDRILELVSREPGVLQRNLKKRLATDDGRRLSTLVQWLGKAGRLLLEREGKTYRLFLSSSPK